MKLNSPRSRSEATPPAHPAVGNESAYLVSSASLTLRDAVHDPGSAMILPDPVHPATIVVVVVALGHLTQRKHIFHESHVPSQQT